MFKTSKNAHKDLLQWTRKNIYSEVFDIIYCDANESDTNDNTIFIDVCYPNETTELVKKWNTENIEELHNYKVENYDFFVFLHELGHLATAKLIDKIEWLTYAYNRMSLSFTKEDMKKYFETKPERYANQFAIDFIKSKGDDIVRLENEYNSLIKNVYEGIDNQG